MWPERALHRAEGHIAGEGMKLERAYSQLEGHIAGEGAKPERAYI